MTHDGIKRLLSDYGYEDSLVFEDPSYDDAFVGVSHDGRAVYDYERMVGCLVAEGMEPEDAEEFIAYNTIRSIPYYGDKAPIVMIGVEA